MKLIKRDLSPCEKFERFWQESLDTSRPRWDEYWFDLAWADHLAACSRCRERNQRYRQLIQALEQWNPDVGEVPDLSESSLALWRARPRPTLSERATQIGPPTRVIQRLWDRVVDLCRRVTGRG